MKRFSKRKRKKEIGHDDNSAARGDVHSVQSSAPNRDVPQRRTIHRSVYRPPVKFNSYIFIAQFREYLLRRILTYTYSVFARLLRRIKGEHRVTRNVIIRNLLALETAHKVSKESFVIVT